MLYEKKTRASYETVSLNSLTARQFFSLISRIYWIFYLPFLPCYFASLFRSRFFSVSFSLLPTFFSIFFHYARFWTIALVMRAIYYIKGHQGKKTGEFSFFRSIPSRIQKEGECSYNEEKLNRLLSEVREEMPRLMQGYFIRIVIASSYRFINRWIEKRSAAASDLPGVRWDGKLDERHACGESVKSESNYRF